MSAESSGREGAEKFIAHLLSARLRLEGLTAGVLQELTEKLEESGNQLQLALLRHLQRVYSGERGSAVSEADEATLRLGSMLNAGSKQHRQLARLAEQHSDICSRIAKLELEVQSVQAAAAMQVQMEDFEHLFAEGKYASAASCAAAVLRNQSLDSEPELLTAVADRASALGEHLASHIVRCITFDSSSSNRRQLAVVADGALRDAWDGLQTLQQAEAPLESLTHQLWGQLLLPILEASSSVRVRSGQLPSEQGTVAILDVEIGSIAEEASQPLEAVLVNCLQYVADCVLQKQMALVSHMGQELWPKLAIAYIEQRLQPHIPIDDVGWDAFEEASTSGRQLEEGAAAIGYIEGSVDTGLIQAFIRQAQQGFLQAKRLEVVEQARCMILAPDYDTVPVGIPLPMDASGAKSSDNRAGSWDNGSGASADYITDPGGLNWGPEGEEGPLLSIGTFQISRTAEAVGSLMRTTLQNAAVSGSPAVAHAKLLALKDVAALYAALPPVIHRQQLQVPQLAALFYCDCQHLAQLLLTLPHCFPLRLEGSASSQINLLEDVMRVRAAGEACLDLQAQHQAVEIGELLAGANGFRRVDKAQHGISARKVVQQTLHALRRAGSQLRDVLPPAAYVAFAGALLDAATIRVVSDLMAIQDISVEESEDLPRILEPLVQEAAATLAGSKPGKDAMSPRLLARAVAEAAPGLAKLQEVVAILGARLVDIREWWENGRLKTHGLSAQEVSHLVEALFEDTDLRQEVLGLIARQ